MTPIHILGKVNRTSYIWFHNTNWMVCVSVHVYVFLSVVCYDSRCLAQCSGISATVMVLLESYLATSAPLPQMCYFLSFFLPCGIPRDGSWDLQTIKGVIIGSSVQYCMFCFFICSSRDISTLLLSHRLFKASLPMENTPGFILIFRM